MEPAPLGGSCKEKFPHTVKPPHWQGWGGELPSLRGEGSNRGAEGRAERFPHGGWVLPALTSPRGLSAHPPERVGAGC